MEIGLTGTGWIRRPNRAAEEASPIIWSFMMMSRKNIIITINTFYIPACILKPRVLIRCVVQNKIQDDTDTRFMKFMNQSLHIGHRSHSLINRVIVGDIIPIIDLR